jgi:two-component system, OmpR family, sensor kinase
MSLRIKILLATSLAVVLSLALLGNFAISTYRSISLESLSSRLDSTLREIEDVDDSPLQAAFYLSTVSNYPLFVGISNLNGRITSLSELEIPVSRLPIEDLETASKTAIEESTDQILVRTINLEGSGYVVIATDLQAINQTVEDLSRNVFLAALLLIMSNALFLHLLTRRDFNHVKRLAGEANKIAKGNYRETITPVPGKNEVAELSQSISAMTESLKANAENLQVLFGSISHELKTPLTAIRGYIELLETSPQLTDEQIKSIDIIQSEVERMTLLINDLLLVSKLGALEYELNDRFDVVDLLQTRLQVVRDLQPERSVMVQGEPSLIIRASKVLIERLIDNLISNLLHHTSATTGVAFKLETDTKTWSILYQDRGPGLPESYGTGTNITFQKFDPRKSVGTSTGLGLFIIQSIVKQHHGLIEVGPSPGLQLKLIFPLE